MAVKDHFTAVQKIYIAYYQRPADPAGLLYWSQRIEDEGGNLSSVIDAFANSQEARTLYGEITNDSVGKVIDAIYTSLFGRAPEPAGRDYYIEQFALGNVTPGNIALSVLHAAQNEDSQSIANKVASADEFTRLVAGRTFDDPAFGAQPSQFAFAYDTDEAADAARGFLAKVTHNEVTFPAVGDLEQWLGRPEAISVIDQDNLITFSNVAGGKVWVLDFGSPTDEFAGNEDYRSMTVTDGASTTTINISIDSAFSVPAGLTLEISKDLASGEEGPESGWTFTGAGTLILTGEASIAQIISLDLQSNFVPPFTGTLVYNLLDTHANLTDPANAAIVAGAQGYASTDGVDQAMFSHGELVELYWAAYEQTDAYADDNAGQHSDVDVIGSLANDGTVATDLVAG